MRETKRHPRQNPIKPGVCQIPAQSRLLNDLAICETIAPVVERSAVDHEPFKLALVEIYCSD